MDYLSCMSSSIMVAAKFHGDEFLTVQNVAFLPWGWPMHLILMAAVAMVQPWSQWSCTSLGTKMMRKSPYKYCFVLDHLVFAPG